MHADRDKWFELEYNVSISRLVYNLLLYSDIFFKAINASPQDKFDVAKISENIARNRFGNIYPCKLLAIIINDILLL